MWIRLLLLTVLLAAGCTSGPSFDDVLVAQGKKPNNPSADKDRDDPNGDIVDGPRGFIGSACTADADCDYTDGVCLFESEGFPRGTCSMACDQYCPDAEGFPTTFCADTGEVPEADGLGDGACLARCDMGLYPDGGCRTGYGCTIVSRANEDTEKYVCVPDAPSDLTQCHLDLAARGVPFEPTLIADRSPSSHPGLTCHIEEPVQLGTRIRGVDVVYYQDSTPDSVLASCDMAHALTDTILDVRAEGVDTLRHLGTWNCRTISGTNTLSRHAYADAIDIYGFDFKDGRSYTLVDDWEHDTSQPSSRGAAFLYDAAQRWHRDETWNIILTPNYNAGHDNHFHVDLTPGSDYLGFVAPDRSWIGPNPSGD